MTNPEATRASGLLLHVSSLPSAHGIGDLGPGAHRFADFLAESGQRLWQLLPLSPTDPLYGNSPYRSDSGFAISRLFASPELLAWDGLLTRSELDAAPGMAAGRVDYPAAAAIKQELLRTAFGRSSEDDTLACFRRENADWLDDYVLFRALKRRFGGTAWQDWPAPLRDREPGALPRARREAGVVVSEEEFVQYTLHRQWHALREHCGRLGIRLVGDIPFYVDSDSADAWAHPMLFRLDRSGRPTEVAGVPPGSHSADGQLWGNPVYDWAEHEHRGFDWWARRVARSLDLFDLVRIDHFRGLVSSWQVPARSRTARQGTWQPTPGAKLLDTLLERHAGTRFIAEDLGYMTGEVEDLRDRYRLPGTRVLLLALADDDPTASRHHPANVGPGCVYYTGTHDDNTLRGWLDVDATRKQRAAATGLAGQGVTADELPRELIRVVSMSPADTTVFPLQDILGLDGRARMNRPGTKAGNWQWRLAPGQLTGELAAELRALTAAAGRVWRA